MNFELFKEYVDYNINLTDSEKYVLIIGAVSQTPEQAYAATVGLQNLVISRNILGKLGFINITDNKLNLTDKGRDSLVAFNLVDDSNQPTETGNLIINKFKIPD